MQFSSGSFIQKSQKHLSFFFQANPELESKLKKTLKELNELKVEKKVTDFYRVIAAFGTQKYLHIMLF